MMGFNNRLFLILFVPTIFSLIIADNHPVVKVKQGWIRGKEVKLVTNDGTYFAFKGIPYAAAPQGNLRFKAPQPPQTWEGIRDATEYGPKCPQYDQTPILTFPDIIDQGEDCLSLNVYTTDLKPETPKPVLFYIHGGASKSGSGNSEELGPDFLVPHDVILVTMNYRLEVLGFLCMDTIDVPGNAALKDQLAAIRWVHENIAQFGGDPNNVSLMGHSSGAAHATILALSPLIKGIINRVIALSGTALNEWELPFEPRRRAFQLGKLLGFETEDADELLLYLQSLPVEKLVNITLPLFTYEEIGNFQLKQYPFVPVVEKRLGQEAIITQDFEEALRNGHVQEIDLMIGHTSKEAIFTIQGDAFPSTLKYDKFPELLLPKKILQTNTALQVLEKADKMKKFYFGDKDINNDTFNQFIDYYSDAGFAYYAHKFANLYPIKEGHSKYFYFFTINDDKNFFNGEEFGVTGVSHLEDTVHLFNAEFMNLSVNKSDESYKNIVTFCTLITNFVKYGNPTPDSSLGVQWPEYNTDTRYYLDIGNTLSVGQNLYQEKVELWDSIFDTDSFKATKSNVKTPTSVSNAKTENSSSNKPSKVDNKKGKDQKPRLRRPAL